MQIYIGPLKESLIRVASDLIHCNHGKEARRSKGVHKERPVLNLFTIFVETVVKMVLTEDQKQVKALLTETITLLCKNGLHFRSEFSIDGLIGITLDQDNVFLVSIKETIKCDSSQNNDLVHISQTKTESVSRMSPSQSRGKKHARTNEALTTDKTSATSQTRVNYPSATVEESGFATHPEMPDVKLEFGITDTQDHSRLGFEDPSVTEELFSGAATMRHSRTDISRNNSDANVQKDAAVSRHCESLEPSHKRLCTSDHTKTNESPADDDRTAEFHDNVVPGSRVCKTEPLDVVEIPDDEMESSLNSDNSYLMYMSMYGGGADGGAVSTDAAYSAQYDMSQMNQHSNVAGCSSWSTTQRNSNVFNNQDKVSGEL